MNTKKEEVEEKEERMFNKRTNVEEEKEMEK